MTNRKERFVLQRLIPMPQHAAMLSDQQFALTNASRVVVEVNIPSEQALHVLKSFTNWWQCTPAFDLKPLTETLPAEGYTIAVTADCCQIKAADEHGLLYALATLRQLAEPERNVMITKRWFLPCVAIEDAPSAPVRALHLCWFPETQEYEIERKIRLAALCKFNVVIIESWGVLKYKSHPEFCWDEYAVEPSHFTRLVNLARDLGVTLVPQINLFGHATMSRGGTGKHVLLDRHPEYESLYEPDGWSWCLSSAATRQYLTDLVTEQLDIFQNPPYFHIGCDEAPNSGSCSLCSENFPRVLIDHLTYFRDLLASRDCRAMMWHDMLLARGDARWRGYYANGDNETEVQQLIDSLPRDIIICDWHYGYPEIDGQEPQWPTMRYFKSLGFDVMPCPWRNVRGARSLGKLVQTLKLPGYIMTTWHECQSSRRYQEIFQNGSQAAWNPDALPQNVDIIDFTNRLVRMVNQDAGMTDYAQFGSIEYQIPRYPNQ